MFIYELPYCGEKFSIKPFLFKNQVDVARLLYDDNDEGLAQYLVEFFNIERLNILDKFFVIVKAVELFVDNSVSLNVKEGNLNVELKVLLKELLQEKTYKKSYEIDRFKLELDLPTNFSCKPSGDIFVSVIQTISIDNEILDFTNLNEGDKSRILSMLPTKIFTALKEYTESIQLRVNFLSDITSKRNINAIHVNFLSNDPFIFTKNLFAKYSVHTCREIIYHLSKNLSSDTIFNSTLHDIEYYISEFSKERAPQDGNSISL